MTEPSPFGPEDAALMWRVLAHWIRRSTSPRSTLVAMMLRDFRPVGSHELDQALPRQELPLKLADRGWLIGSALPRCQPEAIPVATVSLDRSAHGLVTGAAFRVAIFREREEGTVGAEGWRFEQAEALASPTPENPLPAPPAHPYNHAQAIIGWTTKSDRCLIHPTHDGDEDCDGLDAGHDDSVNAERLRAASATLTSHPAFPLSSKTLTGLALSMLATLYGAHMPTELVASDPLLSRAGGEIAADIAALSLA